MKYQAPYGSTDPNAGYVDRDSSSATSGSRVPAAAVEDIQRELVALIVAAGMTPDDADLTQVLKAIRLQTPPGTGAYFKYVSATSSQLLPDAGGQLWINGRNYAVPAGLVIANTGLANSTKYYVYAYMNGANMAIEVVTTGWTLASNGIKQKTGDVSRTLVGMVVTSASGQFQPQGYGTISYFNRKSVRVSSNGEQSGATASTVNIEINVAARATFLTWGDNSFVLSIYGYDWNSTTGKATHSTPSLDGNIITGIVFNYSGAGIEINLSQSFGYHAVEGLHYITIFGSTDSGGTANFGGLGSTATVFG